ncbi:MAG: radical SAM/SPASM domain-containing protein [Victivallaceae bacterium]|nr:radical SAM/SPASM domain-containing protein [Victivallaceae bacterium]
MYSFNGLSCVNVELTSRCNKNCWMCGRRKVERDYPELVIKYGDMDFSLLEKIAAQLPPDIVVQLHNNGEPTLYPRLKEAIALFSRQITQFDTNGKLLLERADDIIGNLDTMAVSVIENDPEAEGQYEILKQFLSRKKDRRPFVVARLNGKVDSTRYEELGLTVARRLLHAKMGSYNYTMSPTVPELGICLDFLNHMAINKDGEVSICVRFDPKRLGVIGNAATTPLVDIWNGSRRRQWLEAHKQGRRKDVPLCAYCDFWGVPTGPGNKNLNRKDLEK